MCLALKLSLNPVHFVSDKALVGVNKTWAHYRQVARDAILPSPNRLCAVYVVPYVEILALCRCSGATRYNG